MSGGGGVSNADGEGGVGVRWAVAEAGCPTQGAEDPWDDPNHHRPTLCSLAASRGNLAALISLRGEGFEWKDPTNIRVR